MRTRSLLLVVGVILTALTGCASSPLFVEDIRSAEMADGPILVVLPVSGVEGDTGERLGQNMAWGLREAGYPAIYADEPDPRQPALRGAIDETDFGEEVVWLSLRWTVHAPAAKTGDGSLGNVVGVHRHQVATTIEQWAVLSRQAANMIVAEAVPAIHELSSPLVFPDGVPVRSAGDLVPDRQLASLSEVNEGDTVVVSGDGMIVLPAENNASSSGSQDVQVAQFEPVFKPAAADPALATKPALQTVDEPEPEAIANPELGTVEKPEPVPAATVSARVVPDAPPPKPDVAAESKSNKLIPTPAGQLLNTDDEEAAAMPSVPRESVTSEPVTKVADQFNDGESPFSAIGDGSSAVDDIDVLTPASAALVTTDPWLTINEPMAMTESAPENSAGETGGRDAGQKVVVTEVAPIPPPEAPEPATEGTIEPAAPQAEMDVAQSEAFAQPVNETVVAELPTEAQQPQTDQQTDAVEVDNTPSSTEVAAGEVSAGALDARAAPNGGRPIFLVRQVAGAPGDGNTALTGAIREALKQVSAAVTNDPAQATHILQGNVRVDSPFAGRQKVRIVWQVTRIDGTETGKAVQENQVPQGSLDGAWGSTARKVAEAAVVGVAGLFPQSISGATAPGLAQPDLPHVGND